MNINYGKFSIGFHSSATLILTNTHLFISKWKSKLFKVAICRRCTLALLNQQYQYSYYSTTRKKHTQNWMNLICSKKEKLFQLWKNPDHELKCNPTTREAFFWFHNKNLENWRWKTTYFISFSFNFSVILPQQSKWNWV